MRALIPIGLAATLAACSAGDPAELSNPFDPRNAQRDDDGDGVPNAEEIAAGGDPRNSDSDGDSLADDVDPCPNAKGDGECLTEGVCAGARTGCPCADEYPDTYDGVDEVRCDGLDNDCDGEVDEGDPGGGGDCDTGASGICAAGTEHCIEAGIACVANAEASTEICDGLDNDCDGSTDEDNPGGGDACDTGQPGECAGGTQTCVEGALSCVADKQAAPAEACNGLDDDCDGSTDEEDPGGGGACLTGEPGVCSDGVEHCVQGGIVCIANAQAGEEACDSIDNDCDGEVDEADPRLGEGCQVQGAQGACAAGEQACVGGQLSCTGPGPVEERCDGVDNDCDGEEDEDDPEGGGVCNTGLEGVCAAGTVHCVEGGVQCVQDEQAADVDTCDGFDNDCDGDTDEEAPEEGADCDTGEQGVCADGLTVCELGEVECERQVAPSRDECDGLDNDCDGDTDEDDPDEGDACDTGDDGVCADGFIECREGEDTCVPERQAGDELCGLDEDEDCDGEVDERCNGCPEGTIVPDGWVCIPPTPAEGFVMGSPANEAGRAAHEDPQHTVHITRPFFMQETELTREQWFEVAPAAPFRAIACGADCPVCNGCDLGCMTGDACLTDLQTCWDAECDACVRECMECRMDCPAAAMHWIAALKVANERSELAGLPSCYQLGEERGVLGHDYWLSTAGWAQTFSCQGYRLPTEAEWEWAARAGTTTATFAGDFQVGLEPDGANRCNSYDNLDDYVWYCGNAGQAEVAGGKLPNPWGLYDILGNVTEWTWDWYNPYPQIEVTDPTGGGPPDPQEKVVRGGSYFDAWNAVRSANRWKAAVNRRFANYGMRLVRTVPSN